MNPAHTTVLCNQTCQVLLNVKQSDIGLRWDFNLCWLVVRIVGIQMQLGIFQDLVFPNPALQSSVLVPFLQVIQRCGRADNGQYLLIVDFSLLNCAWPVTNILHKLNHYDLVAGEQWRARCKKKNSAGF